MKKLVPKEINRELQKIFRNRKDTKYFVVHFIHQKTLNAIFFCLSCTPVVPVSLRDSRVGRRQFRGSSSPRQASSRATGARACRASSSSVPPPHAWPPRSPLAETFRGCPLPEMKERMKIKMYTKLEKLKIN